MLYEITIPQFIKMLGNLSRMLDKAEEYATAKKFDVEVLLNSRLAPDQFNFIKQVQMTCDTAKNYVPRVTGQEAPAHEDNEKTVADLKARIQKVTEYLGTISSEAFAGTEQNHVTQPRWEGKYLTGEEYTLQHAIPNFYFHLTTAYSILRNNGVDVGKRSYLGEMPYKK